MKFQNVVFEIDSQDANFIILRVPPSITKQFYKSNKKYPSKCLVSGEIEEVN